MEKVTKYPSLSGTVLIHACVCAVIQIASFYSPKCLSFGHPIRNINFKRMILKERHWGQGGCFGLEMPN